MPRLTFILGGARSGKSRYAEEVIEALPSPWTYIATAQGYDEEMRQRIALHRARRSEQWVTLDSPVHLGLALDEAGETPVLVDCLTLWLTNVMLGEYEMDQAIEAFFEALAERRGPTVLVSTEVGLGIVPDNALARQFRDDAGLLHQRVAAMADAVVLMVAGLPLKVK